MEYFHTVLLVLQVVAAIGMVIFILLQQGKGADMGSSFGSGAATSLFGASGGANFLSRTTAIFAVVFFASTLGQAVLQGGLGKGDGGGSSVLETAAPSTSAPANTAATIPSSAPAAQTANDSSTGTSNAAGVIPNSTSPAPAASAAAETKAPSSTDKSATADKTNTSDKPAPTKP